MLIHRTKEEALVENARSVKATQQQRRSLILSDLTVEIASRRKRCSVRRFHQQLPLMTAAMRVSEGSAGSHPEPNENLNDNGFVSLTCESES